jgi:hypothetical protein
MICNDMCFGGKGAEEVGQLGPAGLECVTLKTGTSWHVQKLLQSCQCCPWLPFLPHEAMHTASKCIMFIGQNQIMPCLPQASF